MFWIIHDQSTDVHHHARNKHKNERKKMAHFVIVQLGRDVSGPWLTLLNASIPLSKNSLSSVSLGRPSLPLPLKLITAPLSLLSLLAIVFLLSNVASL
jgi:hypothetical protein